MQPATSSPLDDVFFSLELTLHSCDKCIVLVVVFLLIGSITIPSVFIGASSGEILSSYNYSTEYVIFSFMITTNLKLQVFKKYR